MSKRKYRIMTIPKNFKGRKKCEYSVQSAEEGSEEWKEEYIFLTMREAQAYRNLIEFLDRNK